MTLTIYPSSISESVLAKPFEAVDFEGEKPATTDDER